MALIKTLLERQNATTLVARCGDIALYHDVGRYWLYSGGDAIQSVFDVTAPTELVMNYQKYMLAALVVAGKMPQHVLNLGFGIGAFERCFSAISTPPKQWLAIEKNTALIELVAQHIPLAPSWPVINDDALHFIESDQRQHDLILVDLFCGQYHAQCIEQPDFFNLLANHLAADGVLALNLAPKSNEHLIALLARAKRCFGGGFLGKSEDSANVILILTHKSQQPLNSYVKSATYLDEFKSLELPQRLQTMHPIFPLALG